MYIHIPDKIWFHNDHERKGFKKIPSTHIWHWHWHLTTNRHVCEKSLWRYHQCASNISSFSYINVSVEPEKKKYCMHCAWNGPARSEKMAGQKFVRFCILMGILKIPENFFSWYHFLCYKKICLNFSKCFSGHFAKKFFLAVTNFWTFLMNFSQKIFFANFRLKKSC